jgi:hypothetical protein
MTPLRLEDAHDAKLAMQTPDRDGAWSGPYEAGSVWAVLDGAGTIAVNGDILAIEHAGAYPVIEHKRHTAGIVELEIGTGVECIATCFTPGVA